ncbi:MAG: hypothetical protein M5U34_48020 [Chloroflexi bacterium]|nr:hypothetical protein [Chloroflexota bacterium]
MPIPVKSRRYDERFYEAIKGRGGSNKSTAFTKSLDEINDDLFG